MGGVTGQVAAPPSRGLPAAYGVWLGGALVSQVGDAALYFALGWAAAGIGGSAAGYVLSAVAFPRTVLMVLGGSVGDRVGARKVMIVGDAVMLVVAVVLGAAVCRWGTPLPFLLVAGLLVGTVDAFYLPSAGSMPRRLVADEQLARAVALRQSGSQLVAMIGGPVAGAVVASAGFAAAAWVDAATFATAVAALIVIRPRFDMPREAAPEPFPRAGADGIRVAARIPGLGPALLLAGGAAGFFIPTTSLLVPLLAREDHWTAATAGLIVGAQGSGMIAATLAVACRGTARRPGLAAAAGLLVIAGGQVLLAGSHVASLAVAAAVLLGLGSGTFVANLSPILLGSAPRSHLARVQALLSLVQSAVLLVTDNMLGAVTRVASASLGLLCCAAALTASASIAVLAPTLRNLSSAPMRRPG